MRTRRMPIKRVPLIALATGVCGLNAASAGPPSTGLIDQEHPAATQHARARLIAQQPAAVPGTTLMLGVTFEIDPGWHLYWDGLNDTGLPPQVELSLPEGFEVGQILWPAPARHITGDRDLLDHIYEDRVTLMIPVRVPTTLDTTGLTHHTIQIRASVDWLVCDEACLPEFAQLTMDLPVRSHVPGDSPDGPLFAKARERLPRAIKPDRSPIAARWEGTTLEIIAPAASQIVFYPGAKSTELRDRFADAVARDGPMRLRFEPRRGKAVRAVGVIELLDARRRTIGLHAIDLDPTRSLDLGIPPNRMNDDTPGPPTGTTQEQTRQPHRDGR